MTRTLGGIFLVCLISALIYPAVAANEPIQETETLALGGPRGVKIKINQLEGSFSVAVEMTPVTCFDDKTNASVNRTKAESYALVGFCQSSFGKARLLSHDTLTSTRSDAVFKGVVVENAVQQGDKYRLRLVIPEKGIHPPAPKVVASKPFDRNSPLFTRCGDHEATIGALGRTFVTTLTKLVDDLTDPTDDPIATVEDLKQEGDSQFAALKKLIEGDNLLLDTTERPELLEKLDLANKDWGREVEACIVRLMKKRRP